MRQSQRVFFGPNDPWQAEEPTPLEKTARVSRTSPDSPFSRFIGNEQSVRKLQAAAYDALGHENHLMRELSFAILGPSSAGKTTLARLYAEVVELPFVEISPKSVKTLDDVLKQINKVLTEEGLGLIEMIRPGHFILPPTVILLDEVHAFSDSIIQGLLKATEYNDALMATERGRTLDTKNATWFVATTDEGKLFDAFRTRFSNVQLQYLGKTDIAKIVQLANPDLTSEICMLVSHYNSRVPRKALEFARYMRLVKNMEPGLSWEQVAKQVASDEGIDEHGMQKVHLKILRALGNGPIARNRIALVAGSKDEEVDRYIMPWLLTETDDQPALVHVTSKGYMITAAGIAELEKRGIKHKGSAVAVLG